MQDLAIHPVELNILFGIKLLRIHFFLRQKRALVSGVDEEQEQDQQEKLDQEHQEQDKLNQYYKEQDGQNQKHQEQDGLNQEHQEQEHLEQERVGSREILNEVGRY